VLGRESTWEYKGVMLSKLQLEDEVVEGSQNIRVEASECPERAGAKICVTPMENSNILSRDGGFLQSIREWMRIIHDLLRSHHPHSYWDGARSHLPPWGCCILLASSVQSCP
jgi:predicted RNA-binding protein YlqC (UPF0109 family)